MTMTMTNKSFTIRRFFLTQVTGFLGWMLLVLVLSGILFQVEQKRQQRYFRVDLQIRDAGNFKVFYSEDGTFSEENSYQVRIPARNHFTNTVVPLPSGKISFLRIDPTDNTSVYGLRDLEITNGFGESVQRFSMDLLKPLHAHTFYEIKDGSLLSSETNLDPDPAFLLQMDPGIECRQVDIRFMLEVLYGNYRLQLLILLGLFLWRNVYGIYGSLAFFFWLIFNPGFYSPDSIDQIIQASKGVYWNQHPPVMAWIMRFWLKTGFEIPDLIFLQGFLGVFGARYLIHSCLRVLLAGKKLISGMWMEAISAIGLLLLFSVYSPFCYYLNTLWKDSWAVIQFIWLFGFLVSCVHGVRNGTTLAFWRIAGLWLLMVLIVLTRYNAIVILPVFAVILFILLWKRGGWISVGLSVVFFVSSFAAKPLLHRYLQVREFPIENQMMTLDLIGFYTKFPELQKELPYTASSLIEGWETRFEWANIYPISFDQPKIVTEEYGSYTIENPRLKAEYFGVFRSHPIRMMRVKWTHFTHLFGLESTHYWFMSGITPNDFGIRKTPDFASWRNFYVHRSFKVATRALRWFSGVHLVWFVANLLTIAWFAGQWVFQKSIDRVYGVFLYLIPLAYYLSYLISSPARDFRYMYPATMLLQISCFSLLGYGFARLFTRWKTPKASS